MTLGVPRIVLCLRPLRALALLEGGSQEEGDPPTVSVAFYGDINLPRTTLNGSTITTDRSSAPTFGGLALGTTPPRKRRVGCGTFEEGESKRDL